MQIRKGFIRSGFGELGGTPHKEFPGMSPPPWGLQRGRKETETLFSSRCAIFSISESPFFKLL